MARELTGRTVFGITAGAFGIIIAVNAVMAWSAVSTFPGLEVRNSYVESQGFNARLAAQRALGWTTEARLDEGGVTLAISDAQGAPVHAQALSATLSRPTHQRDDQVLQMTYADGAYHAPVQVDGGRWNLEFTATAADGATFRQRIELVRR